MKQAVAGCMADSLRGILTPTKTCAIHFVSPGAKNIFFQPTWLQRYLVNRFVN
jgi:hypothetical protein